MTQLDGQIGTEAEPYALYVYSLRSPPTKETYFRRLHGIFDAIELEGTIFDTRCNLFAMKGIEDPSWAFSCILRFIQSQKNRVDRKEITGGTLRNCIKVI